MDNSIYFKDIFELIHDYKKYKLLTFLIQNDRKFLKEIGFSESDNNLLNLEFKNFLIEQNEKVLAYIENQEYSVFEKFLNK